MSSLSEDHIDTGRNRVHSTTGGSVVFWMLLLMSVAAFAPCILLPEWRELQALKLAEEAESFRVERMQERVDREERLLDAVRSDPVLVARLAQRELGLRVPHENTMPLPGTSRANDTIPNTVVADPGDKVLADIPLRAVKPGAVWPDLMWDRIFFDDRTRPLIMAMSIGLALIAFGLFGRNHQPHAEETGSV